MSSAEFPNENASDTAEDTGRPQQDTQSPEADTQTFFFGDAFDD